MFTTMSKCLGAKGYYLFPSTKGEAAIRNRSRKYTRDGHLRRAMCSGHMLFTTEESDDLLKSCPNFFYVTTTRPMPERLFVWAKQKVSNRSHYVNFEKLVSRVKQAIKTGEILKREAFFENYPYIEPTADEERITPHYIIRVSHFAEDADPLLDALNCSGMLGNSNRHNTQSERHEEESIEMLSKRMVENLTGLIRMGNHRNEYLETLASRNADGLQLALNF